LGTLIEYLSRETYPTVERRGAPFAPATGFDTHGVRHSFHNITKSNFLINEKPRKMDSMGLALRLFPVVPGGAFLLHGLVLPFRAEYIT
jgi:hypothetical protein